MNNKKTIKERLEYLKICDEAIKYFDIKPESYFINDKLNNNDYLMNNHSYYMVLKKRILISLLQDEEFKNYTDEIMHDYKDKPTFL